MTKQTTGWKEVKMVLSEFSSTQLLGVLHDLYKFNPATRSFFHSRFLADVDQGEHLEAYKKRIRSAIPIHPERPLRLVEARKAVNEFKKASGRLEDALELMLYYVQCGNDMTLAFGDIGGTFYDSLASMFDSIVQKLIAQADAALVEAWWPRLEQEHKRVDFIGWGYGDSLKDALVELRKAFPAG
jgi:hypothetical protein